MLAKHNGIDHTCLLVSPSSFSAYFFPALYSPICLLIGFFCGILFGRRIIFGFGLGVQTLCMSVFGLSECPTEEVPLPLPLFSKVLLWKMISGYMVLFLGALISSSIFRQSLVTYHNFLDSLNSFLVKFTLSDELFVCVLLLWLRWGIEICD